MILSEDTMLKLKNLEQEMLAYNEHTNLVSKNDAAVLFEKHIKDSLLIEKFFEKYKLQSGAKILDIGTGGGLPALPVALVHSDINVYAVDSIGKKIKFIQNFKGKYHLPNIYPICSRIEDLSLDMRSSFDVVTSRALARLNVLLEYAVPFLKVGGFLVAYKAKTSDEEIKEAEHALSVLNSKVIEVMDCSANGYERNLIIVKKFGECAKVYPRKQGLVKKNPL